MKEYVEHRLVMPVVFSVLLAACDNTGGRTPEYYIDSARVQISEEAYTTAVIQLKNALQLDPDSAEARAMLGKVYVQLNDGAGAEKELLRARELGHYGHAERVALIRARFLQNLYASALEEIPETLSGDAEENGELHILRARALLGMGELQAAAQNFETALEKERSAAAYAGLIEVALANGDLEAAEHHLEQGLSNHPEDPELNILQGEHHFRTQDFIAAEEAFKRAISIDQSNRSLTGRLGLARVQVARNNLTDARSTLSGVIDRMPENGNAILLLAFVSLRLQDYAAARSLAEQILTVDQQNLMAIGILGVSNYFLGHFEQANRLLTSYMNRAPQDMEVRQVLAATKLRFGQPETAYEILQSSAVPDGAGMTFHTLAGYSATLSGRQTEGLLHFQQAAAAEPNDAGAKIRLAATRAAAGQSDEAEKELRRALELDPELELSPEIRGVQREVIETYLREERFDEALAAALTLQQNHPDLKDGYVLAGISYIGLNRETEARTQFHKAREIVPGAPDASSNLAIMELRQGNLNAAKTLLSDVIDHFPDHYNTLLALAAIEARQNNAERTKAWLLRASNARPDAVSPRIYLARLYLASGKPRDALEVAKPGLISDAVNTELLALVATAQMQTGQYNKSILTLNKLINVEPGAIDARLRLAEAYRKTGNLQAMRRTLEKTLEIEPDNLPASLSLARILLAERDPAGASRIVGRLAPAYPDNVEIMQLSGQIALTEGRPEAAVAHFRDAREVLDNRIIAMGLAHAQWQSKDAAGAVATLEDWLSRNERDFLARMQLVKYLLAHEKRTQAKHQLRQTISVNPDFWIAHNDLAWLLYKEAKYDEAAQYAEKANSLAPQNAYVMDTLGLIRLARNDTAGAVEILQAAFDLRPENPDIGLHLAQAQANNGQGESARQTLLKILATDGDFDNRAAAERLLAELGD